MARLHTIGFEQQQQHATFNAVEAGGYQAVGSPTITTIAGEFRSGTAAMECRDGTHYGALALAIPLGTIAYSRFYVRLAALPAASFKLLAFLSGADEIVVVRCTAAGRLQLWRERLAGIPNSAQIGADSAALTPGQWYRVELGHRINGGLGLDYAELRLDGATVASAADTNFTDTATSGLRFGMLSTTTVTVQIDDVALNDNTGTDQASWPGDGKVIMLKAASDALRDAGWVRGDGATTNLFDALNNVPPTGGSGGNALRIQNAVSTTTQNFEALTETYAAAGIASADTITLIQAIAQAGDNSGTNQHTVGLAHAANDGGAFNTEQTFVTPAGAVANSPTRWFTGRGNPQYAPAPNINAPARVRIGKRTATTEATYADLLGLVVEYVAGSGASGSATVTGGGAVTTTGQKNAAAAATITGGGAATATTAKAAASSSTVTGGGAPAATGQKGAAATQTITGGGAPAATGQKNATAAATVTGGGELTTTGEAAASGEQHSGSATLTGGGLLTATGQKGAASSPAITGGGANDAAGQKSTAAAATLTGGGLLTTTGLPGGPASGIPGTITPEPAGHISTGRPGRIIPTAPGRIV